MESRFVFETTRPRGDPQPPRAGVEPINIPASYLVEDARMKASFARNNHNTLSYFGPEIHRAVLAVLPQEVLASLTAKSALGWVPFHYDVLLTDAVVAVLDEEHCFWWARHQMLASMQGPILRPLFEAMRRVFGPSPRLMYKTVVRSFDAVMRDAGRIRFEPGANESCEIFWDGVPRSAFDSPSYLRGFCAFLTGVFDVMKRDGTVSLQRSSPTERRVHFRMQWT